MDVKNLLLKDLCARLPYGVKCYAYQFKIDGNHCECYGTLEGIRNGYFHLIDKVSVNGGMTYDTDYLDVKPYLRPMSSLVGKELDECRETCKYRQVGQSVLDCATPQTIDYLISHHFDYRGLIEKGLALEAPEGIYKTESL